MRTPEILLDIPYNKKAGPVRLATYGHVTQTEAFALAGQYLTEANCQKANQLYELIVFQRAVPPELSLSLETFCNLRRGFVVSDNTSGKSTPDKFFYPLEPGDVILAERIKTSSGERRAIDRSDKHSWACDLHIARFAGEGEIFHGTRFNNKTSVWTSDAFANFYNPVLAFRYGEFRMLQP